MQWWGALTKQFTELATIALQESQGMAAAMGRRSFDGVDEPAAASAADADADPFDADADADADTGKPARKSGGARKRAPSTPSKGGGS